MKKVNSQAEQIAFALGKPRRAGNGWSCLCPAHDDSSPSLSLCDSGNRVLWRCFAGCSQDDVGAELKRRGLLSPPNAFIQENARPKPAENSKTAIIQQILADAIPATGTLVQTYLNNRGIHCIPEQLLFHPELYYEPGIFCPAMVAQLVDTKTLEPINSIHRTFLSPDGSQKADVANPKKMLGSAKEAGVLIGIHKTGQPVLVGEGIETVLTGVQATGYCGIAALSATNLERIGLPEDFSDIIILVDHDLNGVGQKAAEKLAPRLHKQCRKVSLVIPPIGQDLNDLLRNGDGQ